MGICGSGGTVLLILNLRTRWTWVVSFTVRPLYPWGNHSHSSQYPLLHFGARTLHKAMSAAFVSSYDFSSIQVFPNISGSTSTVCNQFLLSLPVLLFPYGTGILSQCYVQLTSTSTVCLEVPLASLVHAFTILH